MHPLEHCCRILSKRRYLRGASGGLDPVILGRFHRPTLSSWPVAAATPTTCATCRLAARMDRPRIYTFTRSELPSEKNSCRSKSCEKLAHLFACRTGAQQVCRTNFSIKPPEKIWQVPQQSGVQQDGMNMCKRLAGNLSCRRNAARSRSASEDTAAALFDNASSL